VIKIFILDRNGRPLGRAMRTAVIRTGIIGFGQVASQDHEPAYRASRAFQVTSVAEATAAGRKEAQRLLPHARIYSSHEEMLAAERLDLVDVCSPPSAHLSHAAAAVKCGIPVLCEKPVASSSAEAARIAVVSGDGTPVFPCHNWRFSPGMKLARHLIARGMIGQPMSAAVRIHRTGPATGTAAWNPTWRTEQSISGGGVWMDHGPHVIYLCEDLLGRPVSALSLRNSADSPRGGQVELDISGELHFGNLKAQISLAWNAGRRFTCYEVVGSEGRISITEDAMYYQPENEPSRPLRAQYPLGTPGRRKAWYSALLRHVRRALADQVIHEQLLAEITRVGHTLEAGYLSAASRGRLVVLPGTGPQLAAGPN
jgi:predicted dehydrogenase